MAWFRPPLLHDYAVASTIEWIQTDGVGGIATSSILGANTRKQHAILSVADATKARTVLIASLQETVFDGPHAYDLATNQYANAIHPNGYHALDSFTDAPWPTWQYRFDTVAVERQLILVHGEHTLIARYRISEGDRPVSLVVRPLLAYRGDNTVRLERGSYPTNWQAGGEFLECRPFGDMPALYIAHPNAKVETIVLWYRDFFYQRDCESRVDCIEDLFHPGYLDMEMAPGAPISLIFSTPSPRSVALVEDYLERERARRRATACLLPGDQAPLLPTLLQAADAFVGESTHGAPDIIPGLPWGESAMCRALIAMPGVLLVPRRFAEARAFLVRVADTWKRARSPIGFEPETVMGQMYPVDAPLWVFIAAWRYWEATRDLAFTKATLLPLLKSIAAYCVRGDETRHTEDGLIEAGHEPGANYAPIMPLSTNALWYNAQMILAALMDAAKVRGGKQWHRRASGTFASVGHLFACERRPGLADGVRAVPFERDEALRTSQVLAVGLPFCVVEHPQPIVDLIAEQLATPLGLRTLSPQDSRYVGDGLDVKVLPKHWSGSIDSTWFGCYCDALERVGVPVSASGLFAPFEAELNRRGCGHISGAFAGDAPHEPCDYVASASALGEILRVYARHAAPGRVQV